jgi:hypothetical protein
LGSGADEAGVEGAGENRDSGDSNDHTQEREPVEMSEYEVAFGQKNVYAHASEQDRQSAADSKSQ